MAATDREEADAASTLDRRHAPLLLFENDGKTADGTTHHASDGDATLSFYSIPSKQLLRRRVAEMEGHRYWTTPQGWLLMASRTSPATFLWDPFTGARISLPPDRDGFLRGDDRPKRCLLSSNRVAAADQDCLVLVVDLANTVLWYCRLGNAGGKHDDGSRWLKHEYEFAAAGGAALDDVLWGMRSLTSVGGKFFMSLIDSVVTLDFSPAGAPLFAVIPADMNAARWRPPSGGVLTTELVESQGSLFCVSFSSSDLHMRFVAGIGVFKLDLAAQAWVRAESLGGRAFLVHDEFGASLDAEEVGLKGDCVYYCMPNDKGLYVHDMKRGTTALRDPGSCLGDHCSTKLLMPTC
ncbi:unnamed protein product [Urochloa decumbens]|uniref:KIB1-4 beta-propeller domain-containing protein n=1 Tax=Urochloa decumbens TaxID=240449 RepID=A0ABC9FTX2_9POAL